jgi:hypothetical protein
VPSEALCRFRVDTELHYVGDEGVPEGVEIGVMAFAIFVAKSHLPPALRSLQRYLCLG